MGWGLGAHWSLWESQDSVASMFYLSHSVIWCVSLVSTPGTGCIWVLASNSGW